MRGGSCPSQGLPAVLALKLGPRGSRWQVPIRADAPVSPGDCFSFLETEPAQCFKCKDPRRRRKATHGPRPAGSTVLS